MVTHDEHDHDLHPCYLAAHVYQVRQSLEGWQAGGAIPMTEKNHKAFYRRFPQQIGPPYSDIYCSWVDRPPPPGAAAVAAAAGAYEAHGSDDGCNGRARAMPHIKTCLLVFLWSCRLICLSSLSSCLGCLF